MTDRSDSEGEIQDKNEAKESNHAKCILDLSYTKFKWNINEDFNRFHRPDIQSLFDKLPKKLISDQEEFLN